MMERNGTSVYDLVQAHCCVEVNEEEVIEPLEFINNQQFVSRTFRSVDLSQLVYN